MDLERHQRKLVLLDVKLKIFLNGDTSKTKGRVVSLKNKDDKKSAIYAVENPSVKGSEVWINKGQLDLHIRGKGVTIVTCRKYDEFCTALFHDVFDEDETPVSEENGELTLFEFAEKIGFKNSEARFIIDCHYAKYFPTFRSFSDTIFGAEELIHELGGMYSIYRYDRNEATRMLGFPHGLVSICRLSVRSLVPYRGTEIKITNQSHDENESEKTFGNQRFRVRCKLNVPSYPDPNKILKANRNRKADYLFKYDGYVSRVGKGRNDWRQWLFQQRTLEGHPNNEDLILMYTRPESDFNGVDNLVKTQKKYDFFTGKMSYQDQSDLVIPAMTNILLVKHKEHVHRKGDLDDAILQASMTDERLFYELEGHERPFLRAPKVVNVFSDKSWDELDDIVIPKLLATSG